MTLIKEERAAFRWQRARPDLHKLLSRVARYDHRIPDPEAHIIFFHGLHEQAREYRQQFLDPAEDRGFNTYAHDTLNHGLSIENQNERSLVRLFESHQAIARASVERVVHSKDFDGTRPIILVGHSFGALQVAHLLENRNFMRRYGRFIAGAVCINMVFQVDHNVPPVRRSVLRPILRQLRKMEWGEEFMAHHFIGRSGKVVKGMRELAHERMGDKKKEANPKERSKFAQMMDEAQDAEDKGDLDIATHIRAVAVLTAFEINEAVHKANEHVDRIKTPIIFPHGIHDMEGPIIAVEKAVRRMGHGHIMEYDCGHFVLDEAPESREHILEWIKKRTGMWKSATGAVPAGKQKRTKKKKDMFGRFMSFVTDEVKLVKSWARNLIGKNG